MSALRSIALLAVTLLVACSGSSDTTVEIVGDASEPLQVFERFLALRQSGALGSDEARELVGHELAVAPGGEAIHASLHCNKIVRIDGEHAVARVSVTDEPDDDDEEDADELPERTTDLYWYLEKDDRWRVVAMRAFSFMELQILTTWSEEELERYGDHMEELVENARLTLKSDRELAEWFDESEGAIQALADRARELVDAGAPNEFENGDLNGLEEPPGPLEEELHALHVSSIAVGDGGAIEIVLGGITGREVILRYVPDGKLPHISADEIIWAEPLRSHAPSRSGEGGWFLLRST